jgi:arylsulfatase
MTYQGKPGQDRRSWMFESSRKRSFSMRAVHRWIAALSGLILCLTWLGCGVDERVDEPTRGPTESALSPRLSPNVLLITIDTLRADHVGAYGYPEPVSPNIDALAARGVVYERAIAASSRTAPSHASILTSRYVRDHSIGSVNGATRIQNEETLASALSAAGYQTAAFVSNTVLHPRTGLNKGFSVYDHELPDQEKNRQRIFERRADATTDPALAWLRDAAKPWLLWVHYNDPHGPYDPPPSTASGSTFSGVARGPMRGQEETALPILAEQSGLRGIPAYQKSGDLRLPREYRALYAAEIRFMDESLGRLIESAQRATGEPELIILLTSDHGESQGEDDIFFAHGAGTTPNLVHVPFIVVAPGLSPGRSHDVVHHVDVTPTLLELAGVQPPTQSAGLALARYWQSDTPIPDRVVFADVGDEVSGYRGELFERLRRDQYRESSEVFRWSAEEGWDPHPENAELHARLKSYADRKPPLVAAAAPDAANQERLRALGYVEPESPSDVAQSHTEQGLAAEREGDQERAVSHYREALRAVPQHLEATNNLAWILATTERSELRDPEAAIELAVSALTRDPNSPAILDTLAAAYAAAGRLPEAATAQRLAIESLSTSDKAIVADFQTRLTQYESQLSEAGD